MVPAPAPGMAGKQGLTRVSRTDPPPPGEEMFLLEGGSRQNPLSCTKASCHFMTGAYVAHGIYGQQNPPGAVFSMRTLKSVQWPPTSRITEGKTILTFPEGEIRVPSCKCEMEALTKFAICRRARKWLSGSQNVTDWFLKVENDPRGIKKNTAVGISAFAQWQHHFI